MPPEPPKDNRLSGSNPEVDPSAPLSKSPVKWMVIAAIMFVTLFVASEWDRQKISMILQPTIPPLSQMAQKGRDLINAQCANCHGVDGTGGTRKGPPLLHPMYRLDIYPDFQFKRVMKTGRPERKWRFGPMPAQPQLSAANVNDIISYVRAVQNASGVE